jgi:hypothetical protein
LCIYTKEWKSVLLKRYVHSHVCYSIVHNSKYMESTLASNNGQRDKEDMSYAPREY